MVGQSRETRSARRIGDHSCATDSVFSGGLIPRLSSSLSPRTTQLYLPETRSRDQVVTLSAISSLHRCRNGTPKLASVSIIIWASQHTAPAPHPSRRLLSPVARSPALTNLGHRAERKPVIGNLERGPCSKKGRSVYHTAGMVSWLDSLHFHECLRGPSSDI